jgi:hypothetical protein
MPDPDAKFMNYTPDTHWIYFGDIPPSRIIGADKDRGNFSAAQLRTEDMAVAS